MTETNDSISRDFFANMRPRLKPMSFEEYRNSPKRNQEHKRP
jgi:hypothetical protein